MKTAFPIIATTIVATEPPKGSGDAAGEPRIADKRIAGELKTGTIIDVLRDNPQFSLLVKAIEAADMVEDLDKKEVLTIFAPNDAAFRKLPEGAIGELMLPANKATLQALLRHHLVHGDVLTMSLGDAVGVKSASGETLDIQIGDDRREVAGAKIVDTMVTDTNGVILGVDQILVPEALKDLEILKR